MIKNILNITKNICLDSCQVAVTPTETIFWGVQDCRLIKQLRAENLKTENTTLEELIES